MKTILVTGAAGFIGYHTSRQLCEMGMKVVGIDSLNNYYDPKLKNDRLAQLVPFENFTFCQVDISDKPSLDKLFTDYDINIIINLAAQAGVRYSIENPYQYIDSNIAGFINILEAARNNKIEHLVFASSSSVYGANNKLPFNVNDNTDHPVSLYAATKKANEAMAHSYAALYNIPITGLRFFTVYGPWGRPDMSYYIFIEKILKGDPMQLYNSGNMKRDFTYIDDVVWVITELLSMPPKANPEKKGKQLDISESFAPYKLYNVGNHSPILMTDFVSIMEELLDTRAIIEAKPMQPGDMLETCADVSALAQTIGRAPYTDIKSGLKSFISWYRNYHKC